MNMATDKTFAPASDDDYELKIDVTELDQTLRERLIQILSGDRGAVTITLRSGKEFHFPFRSGESQENLTEEEKREKNLFIKRVAPYESVIVGKNYIEVDVAPGASIPIYEMVPLSEIVSVWYF